MTVTNVAVIGGGHAGDEVVAQLRERGFTGSITLIEETAHIPYERPPLSKGFLTDHLEPASLAIRAAAFYQQHETTHRLGVAVVGMNPTDDHVELRLADGDTATFDAVVLATGMQPRELTVPGADAAGVFYLQGLTDATAIRDALTTAQTVVVIGGGFIGAETAASLRSLGKDTTLIEHGSRLMARAVSEPISHFYENAHRLAGVRLLLTTGVDSIEASGEGRVSGVTTSAGELVPSDCVIASVGVSPRTEIAQSAGLTTDRGFLVVNAKGQSSHPRVYGAGDITLFPHPQGVPRRIPIPSLDNASWSGGVVATSLMGDNTPGPRAVPTFWTEQYGKRTQIAGLLADRDQSVTRGDPSSEHFSVLHYRDEKLIAVEAIGAAHDFQAVKKAIGLDLTIPADLAKWDDLNLPDFVASLETQ